VPGYPIRKSSDHSSADSSPRHIAASHVLHRLLMPRHPPYALTHLHNTQNTKDKPDARIHYALLKEQPHTTHTNPPTPNHPTSHNRPTKQQARYAVRRQQCHNSTTKKTVRPRHKPPKQRPRGPASHTGPFSQDPTVRCPTNPNPTPPRKDRP
jgi:hypothetical protein